ncbi:metal-binding protein [bacterium 1XD8-76]|nr:metal-binding protein [bacterium 1XD8-76]
MENSYRFFENRDCKYFPCHKSTGDFNCLFCYCPLYDRQDCPGNPMYRGKDRGNIKDCTNCIFPHRPENYDEMMRWLR